MKTRRLITLLKLLVAATTAVHAADTPWQFIGQWDNDMLTGTDDGYTNGARIAFARELSPDSAQHSFLQNALIGLTGSEQESTLDDFRFRDSGDVRFQYGVGLTQLMFTPEDPEVLSPARGERPYASWLGLEFSLQARAGDSASTATLSIGTTGGLSYADDMHTWVHKNISSSPVFQGWDSQAPVELTIKRIAPAMARCCCVWVRDLNRKNSTSLG